MQTDDAETKQFRAQWDFHQQVPVEIQGTMIPVDIDMIRIVLWMNSLPGVQTLNCCEGNHPDCRKEPWITFTCEDPKSMKLIENSRYEELKPLQCTKIAEIEDEGDQYRFVLNSYHSLHLWNAWRKYLDEQPKRKLIAGSNVC